MRNQHHFLVICFPSQGNINPSLQLANRLMNLNCNSNTTIEVTFATTVAAARRMTKTPAATKHRFFSFATFSDGFDDTEPDGANISHFFSEFRRCGSQSVAELITSAANQGRPFTFVIYGQLLDWAADVAAAFGIPSALFFAQPATVIAIYFYYFHGYAQSISEQLLQHSVELPLPGLPLLTSGDMPSFFSPSGPHAFLIPPMRTQFEYLSQQTQPTILVNTFDALEPQALRAINDLKMIAIGPLVPTGDNAPSLHGDLFQVSTEDYIGWLNSKAESSVVYVSFGSICVLSEQQEEELLLGLLETGHPFLWVTRSNNNEEKLIKRVEGKGKIVSWCCQIEVLRHSSLGCFMTHCGWNSTMEGIALGLPMIGFPLQIDQPTNGKLVEDVWKIGVRVKANSQGIVERGEIRECLDLVMGSRDIEKK